jgi:hypothetical protein
MDEVDDLKINEEQKIVKDICNGFLVKSLFEPKN